MASMNVYEDFIDYTGGIYEHTYGEYVNGHTIVIVGYGNENGNDYWLCKNSWGENWGEDGYFKIAFGECGIDNTSTITAYVTNESCFAKLVPTLIPNFSNAVSYDFADNNDESCYITDNATIDNGTTSTIEAGTTLTFQNNSKLKVYGTLNVNGTSSNKVTFDFIAPNYSNGIWFYQGSNGTIDNAKIKNAYYGVRMYKSHPTVQNTEIFDCKYGIYFDNLKSVSAIPNVLNNKIHDNYYYGLYFYYSDGKIRGNKIYNNNYGGVIAYSHSSPQFGHDNYLGNNDIHHNGYGFKAYYSSSPDFGRSGCTNQGGNNKIENNTYKNGYAYNSNVWAVPMKIQLQVSCMQIPVIQSIMILGFGIYHLVK